MSKTRYGITMYLNQYIAAFRKISTGLLMFCLVLATQAEILSAHAGNISDNTVNGIEALEKPESNADKFGKSDDSSLAVHAIKTMVPVNADQIETAVMQGSISGTVTDARTGERIPGANVILPALNRGASTNMEGEYSIANVPAGNFVLEVRFIGYQTVRRNITVVSGEALVLNFELTEETLSMDELIVTGTAGDTRRRAVGNAVSRVSATDIMDRSSRSNVTELLQSQTPGLTLIPGSGTAGTAANIRLRGAGSITARTQPIIYVDGVRINSGTLGNFDVFGQSTSALDAINPSDIESIEIIKGPAASTLYGAEAAAGVIQIITKRGTMGERNLRWSFRSDIGQTDWPEMWRPTNYSVCSQARINNAAGHPGCVGRTAGEIISLVPLSDDPDALRKGLMHTQNLSVQGGGQQYSFFVSGSFGTEEGVYLNNYADRGSLRANFQIFPLDNLDFAATVSYTRTEIGLPLGDNTADGLIISSWLANPGQFYPTTRTTGYFTINPTDFNTYDNVTKTDRFVLGGTVTYRPFTWMENRLRVGFDLSNGIAEIYFPPDNPFAARTSLGLGNDDGLIAKAYPRNQEFTFDYNGTITHRINENVVSNTSFGMQYLTTSFARSTAIGQDLGSAAVRSLGSAAVTQSNESFTEQKSLGFFLQEQVAFKDRLFLTGAVRMDNNSAFGTEINTVFYPKFSASYVISDEEFFDVDLIDELRIRAAWGQAGSAPGPFDATQTYGTTATTLPNGTSVSALQYVTFGNPDLKPERGSEIEIGFDIAMFRSRVELEATYYNTTTKDALISVPIAPSIGFSGSQLQNLGEISNQGFEFLLKVVPLISNQFRIEHTISVTTNKNELVSFGDGRDPVRFGVYAPVHRFAEGYPLGGFWSTPVQRDANGNVITGPNGQPLVEAEQTYKGPSAPTREIGLGTTVTMFGNIQLYALFDYKGGNYQFNVKDWRRDRSGVSWETINPDADPREVLARRFAGQTDIHIQKADFIKFRDLSVRYIVPTRFVSRLNISGASITLAGHNLAIWTKYGGADPEINFHGASTFDRNDSWTLPMTRRFSASVNLQF